VLGGADFGLQDPTILLLGAIDPVEGKVYIYDAYSARQLPVPHHAREMKRRLEHVPYGSLKGLMGDPSGKRRNINDRVSIFDNYAEHGIHFEAGDNRIDAGILKVYSYLDMGNLIILSHLTDVIDELTNYHYKPVDLDEKPSEKPADGEDHFADSLRYMIQTLPDDPTAIKTVVYGADDFRHRNNEEHLPFELQTDDVDYYNSPNACMGY